MPEIWIVYNIMICVTCKHCALKNFYIKVMSMKYRIVIYRSCDINLPFFLKKSSKDLEWFFLNIAKVLVFRKTFIILYFIGQGLAEIKNK